MSKRMRKCSSNVRSLEEARLRRKIAGLETRIRELEADLAGRDIGEEWCFRPLAELLSFLNRSPTVDDLSLVYGRSTLGHSGDETELERQRLLGHDFLPNLDEVVESIYLADYDAMIEAFEDPNLLDWFVRGFRTRVKSIVVLAEDAEANGWGNQDAGAILERFRQYEEAVFKQAKRDDAP